MGAPKTMKFMIILVLEIFMLQSMLLIYLDMIMISVVVIVGGADDDHVILYVVTDMTVA